MHTNAKKKSAITNYFSKLNVDTDVIIYRISICIPFIESFISQIKERFLIHQNIFKGFQCLFDDTNSSNNADFESLINFYLRHIDITTATCELQIWKEKMKRMVTKDDEMLPSNALHAIGHCDPVIFPNIFVLLKILCTLPVSTKTPSFSSLKRVKSYLRNSMKEDRLNELALLSYYRNIEITPEEILDEMAKKLKKIDLLL